MIEGYSLLHGLVIVVDSLVAEHRLEHEGFSGCGSKVLERGLSGGAWAQLLHGTWNLP